MVLDRDRLRLNSLKDNARFTGDSYQIWIATMESSNKVRTQSIYIEALGRFLEYADYTTQSLYELGCEHQQMNGNSKLLIPLKIQQYQRTLLDDGKSTSHCKMIEKAVSSFMKSNGLDFDMFKLKIRVTYSRGADRASIQTIRTLVENTPNPRDKAIIMMAKDSGLRSGDICNLLWRHVKPALSSDEPYHTWEMTQEKMEHKTGYKSNPVIGADAIYYLKQWYNFAKHRGYPTDDDFYVFYQAFPTHNGVFGTKLTSMSIVAIYRRIKTRVHLEGKITPHSLRKTHHSVLENAGVPRNFIAKMVGRKIADSTGAYSKPNPDELIKWYSRGYPELSINQVARDNQSSRIDNLERIILELKSRLDSVGNISIKTGVVTD